MCTKILTSKMSERERNIFENKSIKSYFGYVFNSKEFLKIRKKLEEKGEFLTEEEWNYLLDKLYLITYKAILEEEQICFVDRISYLLSQILIRFSERNSPLYNECYRMIEFVQSIKKGTTINEDLFYGYEVVENSLNEEDLDILIRQHEEADTFRFNQDFFLELYGETTSDSINWDERMRIHLFNSAYKRERALVKQYHL